MDSVAGLEKKINIKKYRKENETEKKLKEKTTPVTPKDITTPTNPIHYRINPPPPASSATHPADINQVRLILYKKDIQLVPNLPRSGLHCLEYQRQVKKKKKKKTQHTLIQKPRVLRKQNTTAYLEQAHAIGSYPFSKEKKRKRQIAKKGCIHATGSSPLQDKEKKKRERQIDR